MQSFANIVEPVCKSEAWMMRAVLISIFPPSIVVNLVNSLLDMRRSSSCLLRSNMCSSTSRQSSGSWIFVRLSTSFFTRSSVYVSSDNHKKALRKRMKKRSHVESEQLLRLGRINEPGGIYLDGLVQDRLPAGQRVHSSANGYQLVPHRHLIRG